MTCTRCTRIQYAANDMAYLHLFGICWDCDKDNVENGALALKIFESRERKAEKLVKA